MGVLKILNLVGLGFQSHERRSGFFFNWGFEGGGLGGGGGK